MRKIDLIILHCTATNANNNISAEDIDRYHKQRGFKSIGYHYIVRLDGTIEQGRPMHEIGAHCYGKNAHSIGIAYVGGLNPTGQPSDTRTDAQKASLRNLLKQLKAIFPDAQIRGHNDFANKACPCFNASKEYASL